MFDAGTNLQPRKNLFLFVAHGDESGWVGAVPQLRGIEGFGGGTCFTGRGCVFGQERGLCASGFQVPYCGYIVAHERDNKVHLLVYS